MVNGESVGRLLIDGTEILIHLKGMPTPFNNKIFSWSHFWKEAKEERT